MKKKGKKEKLTQVENELKASLWRQNAILIPIKHSLKYLKVRKGRCGKEEQCLGKAA